MVPTVWVDNRSIKIDAFVRLCTLVFFFILYLFLALNLPTHEAPDEIMRLMVPSYIVKHGCLPLGSDPEIINSIWGTSYGFSAYGSSLFAVPFMVVAKAIFGLPEAVLMAARLANVILAVSTLFVCFLIGDALSLTKCTSLLYVVFIGLLPQFSFIASYFNSDMLEFLSTALVVYCLIKGVQNCWDNRRCIALGTSLGVLALSNYYAYGGIVASVVCYYCSVYKMKSSGYGDTRLSLFVVKPLLVFLSAWLIAGWFFIRNFVLYDGDLFGMATSSQTSELLASTGFKPSERVTPKSLGLSPLEMLSAEYNGVNWIESTVHSSIGILGYMRYPLGDKTYFYYYAILVIGFMAGGASILKKSGKMRGVVLSTTSIFLLTPVVLSVYYSWSSDFQAQGRYIMAPVALSMLIVAIGWSQIAEQIDASLSSRASVAWKIDINVYSIVLGVVALTYCIVFMHVFNGVISPYLLGEPMVEELVAILI